jgi:hypothetical protein
MSIYTILKSLKELRLYRGGLELNELRQSVQSFRLMTEAGMI